METPRHEAGTPAPPLAPDYFNFVMAHLPPRKPPAQLGDWTLRVIHLPESGPELAWDVHYQSGVGEIHQIRFQQSARESLKADSTQQVPTEHGRAQLTENEALVLEVQNGLCLNCQNLQAPQPGGDLYVLNFQHGSEVHSAYARNPRQASVEAAEPWQRLLTRVVGSSLLVQRKVHVE